MLLSDRLGTLTTDMSHLKSFVEAWYEPGDNIALVGIPKDGSGLLSMSRTAKEVSVMTEEEMSTLTFIEHLGRRMSMYMGMNPVREGSVTLRSRGTAKDVKRVIGLFLDLDIKDGSFSSKPEIHQFLRAQPLKPTIVVDNGENGGIHAYWKIAREDQSLSVIDSDVRGGWWAYMQKQAGNSKIDKLTDVTRISRMPSGTYWPSDSGGKSDIVRIHTLNPECVYTAEEVKDLVGDSIHEHRARIEHIRKTNERFFNYRKRIVDNQGGTNPYPDYFSPSVRRDSEESVERRSKDLSATLEQYGLDLSVKQAYLKMAAIEDMYNNQISWDDILVPHGWTYLKTLNDQSREFSRPGKNERSAVVDYVKDDGTISHVMSLLSGSDMTRLSDLKEAEIPLTKFRVALRLNHDDDEVKMLVSHLNGMVE